MISLREGLGGGLLTAIDNNLNPVLISAGNEHFEALIIQVKIGSKDLRIFNCYGPQELCQSQRPASEQTASINTFWQELEKEIINAYEGNCMIVIEMDANAKIGILGEEISRNGKKIIEVFESTDLIIMNQNRKVCKTGERKPVIVSFTR